MPLLPLPDQAAVPASMVAASWAEPRAPHEERTDERLEFSADSADFERHRPQQSETWSVPEPNPQNSAPRFHFQSELDASPRSYRAYVGAALAILLVVLVYMGWRGSAAFWSNVRTPAQIPRAVPAQQPVAAAPQPNSEQNAAEKSLPPATPAAPTVASQNRAETSPSSDVTLDKARVPQIVPANASSGTPAAEQGGSEELATAEKFLDTRAGASRDTREAARWLWKAVAKQNVTATFLLSDLYLRGDGVPKNCDQGRILLDAAARKGVTAAAERLRHLQAFGCQ